MPTQLTPVTVRKIQPVVIQAFKGLNSWLTATATTPETASDLMNVIPSSSGGLEKLRVPVVVSNIQPAASGPAAMFMYLAQTSIVAQFGKALYSYAIAVGGAATGGALGGLQPASPNLFSAVEMNNNLYLANGTDMLVDVGNTLQAWGFAVPAAPVGLTTPSLIGGVSDGNCRVITGINSNAGGVISMTVQDGLFVAVGDLVTLSGVTTTVGPAGSFNFSFPVATVSADFKTLTLNNGPVSNTGAGGQAFAPTFAINIGITALSRVAGVVDITLACNPTKHPFRPGDWITIAGAADPSFNGTFQAVTGVYPDLFYAQAGLPNLVVGAGGTLTTPMTITKGYKYAQAQFDPTTGHFGPLGPTYFVAPPGGVASRLVVNGYPVFDGSALSDGVGVFRTTDGGGDFYQLGAPQNGGGGAAGAWTYQIHDTSDDSGNFGINLQIGAPLLNFAPPAGKYLSKFQGRVYIFNLATDPQGIAYTGYEQILLGRPERTSPPNNRLHLELGADPIRGGGVLQAGVVAFSESDRMFMQRGIVEDITVTIPVNFTSYLEELPWHIGLSSHATVASTPYGLAFLAGDHTVRVFDGQNIPIDISGAAYPVLRSITPGQAQNACGCYFRWLERDWYVITIAINGSVINNRLVFFDLNPDAEKNIGIFLASIQADSLAAGEDPNGTRFLFAGQNGKIVQLVVQSDTTSGISLTPTSTAGQLAAWWEGSYIGNDSPELKKHFRYYRLVSDPPARDADWKMGFSLVDDDTRTFQNPQVVPLAKVFVENRFPVDVKATRCAPLIQFPIEDRSCNVLQLTGYYCPTGVR
jgi:hypothetical protein